MGHSNSPTRRGYKELGPKNANDTKIGVIHNAQEPMLDLTNPKARSTCAGPGSTRSQGPEHHGDDWLYFAWERESKHRQRLHRL